ncbi:MAG: hypothetical protein AAGB34_10315 [Planctomycetota bacterium]
MVAQPNHDDGCVSSRGKSFAGSSRAFALVDAVVGGTLLAVALVAIIGLTGGAVSTQTRAERLAHAAMLADEQLQLVVALGPETYPSSVGLAGDFEEPFEEYRYEVRIVPDGEELFAVEAEVFWEVSRSRERSLLIETTVAVRRGEETDPERQPDQTIERLPQ